MSHSDGPVVLEVSGSIATLRLNRPEAGNAIDLHLAMALHEAVQAVESDASVRCVVLTGTGRFFCVGGDIGSFGTAGTQAGELLKQITEPLHNAVLRLANLRKPVVVAVNGPAAGAGMSLAAIGDIVICAQSAHFSMAYTAIGLTPDGGATNLLPRLIGLRKTQELALTNRRVASTEAVDIGLVSRAVADEAVLSEAMAMAKTLADGPTEAFANTRALLSVGSINSLQVQLDEESRCIAHAAGGAEGQTGIAAFMAKRKPRFRPD